MTNDIERLAQEYAAIEQRHLVLARESKDRGDRAFHKQQAKDFGLRVRRCHAFIQLTKPVERQAAA